METARLIHRKFTPEDLQTLISLRSDEEVMRYLGGWARQNPDALTERLRFYIDCYDQYGFGMCAMFWKETGEMIGWSGLQPLEDSNEIEVGYGMIKEFWGRGIGFETASMWLKHGFETVKLDRIVAVADPANIGSWRIMEKCGMIREKEERHYDMDCVFYGMSRDQYLARKPK
jgi:RimJ/RimL family protein N-acetyltransferase